MEIEIRPATSEDAGAVAAIYGHFVTDTPASFEEVPPSSKQILERIAASHLWLVAEGEDGIVGYAYAAPFHQRAAYRWSAEVSVYVAPHAHGRRVGHGLLATLLKAIAAKGLVNAFAGITLPNEASVRLFESFGFTRIALQRDVGFKLGRWHDVGWWQLQLQKPPLRPSEVD